MSKPEWLVEAEKARSKPEPDTCGTCANIGRFIRQTRHKGKELTWIFECSVHAGCLNTKFSICCDDWEPRDLV